MSKTPTLPTADWAVICPPSVFATDYERYKLQEDPLDNPLSAILPPAMSKPPSLPPAALKPSAVPPAIPTPPTLPLAIPKPPNFQPPQFNVPPPGMKPTPTMPLPTTSTESLIAGPSGTTDTRISAKGGDKGKGKAPEITYVGQPRGQIRRPKKSNEYVDSEGETAPPAPIIKIEVPAPVKRGSAAGGKKKAEDGSAPSGRKRKSAGVDTEVTGGVPPNKKQRRVPTPAAKNLNSDSDDEDEESARGRVPNPPKSTVRMMYAEVEVIKKGGSCNRCKEKNWFCWVGYATPPKKVAPGKTPGKVACWICSQKKEACIWGETFSVSTGDRYPGVGGKPIEPESPSTSTAAAAGHPGDKKRKTTGARSSGSRTKGPGPAKPSRPRKNDKTAKVELPPVSENAMAMEADSELPWPKLDDVMHVDPEEAAPQPSIPTPTEAIRRTSPRVVAPAAQLLVKDAGAGKARQKSTPIPEGRAVTRLTGREPPRKNPLIVQIQN